MSNVILSKKTRLTQREYEILVLKAVKMTDSEVGGKLGISRVVVRYHIRKMMIKLQSFSRSELIDFARSKGWITSKVKPSGEVEHAVTPYEQVQGIRLFKFSS